MQDFRPASSDLISDQPGKHVVRYLGPQERVGFQEPGDIGQIFLALAGAAGGVLDGPHLAAQHIVQEALGTLFSS